MRTVLPLLVLPTLVACGNKKEAAPAAAAEAAPALTVEMPEDPGAKKFAKQLIDTKVENLNPTGSSDFKMAMSFQPDGTWTGTGFAELGGETLDCDEVGTWKIDTMDGESALMDWTITKTNCPNRENGASQRVQFQFAGTTYKVSFR